MLETSLPIDQQLARLPDQPGVYKFYDAKGVLLYVGKAKSLRSRVRSYFLKSATLEPHKRQMVTEIADIQYLLAETPTQALHFEADLVRHERPRYNVKLRDDKHYPYIRINVQEPWPKTMVARKMQRDGARYFGPFTDATSVRQTLDTINRLFPHILCNRVITGNDPRACLYYHIKRCPAPCIGAINNADYRQIVDQMVGFLDGKSDSVLADMRHEMEARRRSAGVRTRRRPARSHPRRRAGRHPAADRLLVDGRRGLRRRLPRGPVLGGAGVPGPRRTADRPRALRPGRPGRRERGRDRVVVRRSSTTARPATSRTSSCCRAAVDDMDSMRVWLTDRRAEATARRAPQGARHGAARGREAQADRAGHQQRARGARTPARQQWLADEARTTGAVVELQECLDLPQLPNRIECYDISHVQGTNQVASMVVFENGQPQRSAYRRFKIKHELGNNDVLSMQEVIGRRFRRALTGQLRRAGEQGTWETAEPTARRPGDETDDEAATREREPEPSPRAAGPKCPTWSSSTAARASSTRALEILDTMEITELPVVGLAKENEEIFVRDRATGRAQADAGPVCRARRRRCTWCSASATKRTASRSPTTATCAGGRGLRSALDDVAGHRSQAQTRAAAALRVGARHPRRDARGAGRRTGHDP